MIVTEKDARRKTCHMTLGPSAYNQQSGGHDYPAEMMCGGASCMAWRWVDAISDDGEGCGYCGLAGRP